MARRFEGVGQLFIAPLTITIMGVSGCSCGADQDDAGAPPILCVSGESSAECEPDGSTLDWGNPVAGEVATLVRRVTNTGPSEGTALRIDAIRFTDESGAAHLFDAQLCQPTCDDQILGIPATLGPGESAQLVMTFDATGLDGIVPAESLEIVHNGAADETEPTGVYVRPFEGLIAGCLPGRIDANDDKTDGCECAPSDDGTEFCDGLDNDCDGLVDEEVAGTGVSCDTGLLGNCGPGSFVCADGMFACAPDNAVEDETCDGLDNDCDGVIDEENTWFPFNEGLTGGNMGAVAFDPRTPGVVYAVTGSRVYRSSDAGLSFEFVGEASAGITGLGFPSTDPSRVIASSISGVLASDDEGETWTQLSLNGVALTTILVHPADPAHVYVGTNGGGILRSTNGAMAFAAVNEGVPYGTISSILGADDDPDQVVVGVQLFGPQNTTNGEGAALFTTNGGANWTTTTTDVGRIISMSSCTADTDVLYAASYFTGIIQSVDGGASWNTVALPSTPVTGVGVAPSNCLAVYGATEYGGGIYHADDGAVFAGPLGDIDAQRPGDARFSVHPTDPDVALLANHSGIFRTTDAGVTWTRVAGVDAAIVRDLAVSPAAPNVVSLATWGQGPWQRTGTSSVWQRVPAATLPRDWAITVAPDPADSMRHIIGAWPEIWQTDDAGGTYFTTAGPTNVFAVGYHPTDPSIVYAGTQTGGMWKSVDGGQSYTEANVGLPDPWNTGSCVCRDVRALVVDEATPETLYIGTHVNGAYVSTDGAANWQPMSDLAGESVYCLAQDPIGDLLACVSGKGIWRSSDGGASFSKITEGLAELNNVSDIYVDPLTGDIYAAADGVYRSDDGGSTWDGMDNDCLPNAGASNPVVLDDGGARLLLIGTGGVGVYALRL